MSSSALKTRTAKLTLAPAKVKGRLARLVGSIRTTVTRVWFGCTGAAGAAGWPGSLLVAEGVAGAQAVPSTTASSAVRYR
jgi:hypothetical protein